MLVTTATVHDAIVASREALRERDDSGSLEELEAAYAVIAGGPLSRLRVSSVHHVAALMSEIQTDESVNLATQNAATTLHLRIANAIGTIDVRTEPPPDPGVPRDHEGGVYRLDTADVLHYEVRSDDNWITPELARPNRPLWRRWTTGGGLAWPTHRATSSYG